MTIGIYLLGFNGTHKLYVGQSKNIEVRYSQHCASLLAGTHTHKLNEAYAKYGMPELEIVEAIPEYDRATLDVLEAKHINLWNSVLDGFNYSKSPHGGTSIGELNPKSNHTDAQIISLVDVMLANQNSSLIEISKTTGIGYNTVKSIANGKTHTWLADVAPDKYSRLLCIKRTNQGERQGSAKYSNESVLKAFNMLLSDITTPNVKVAELCGISESAVIALCNGTNYKWLMEQYPKEYSLLMGSLAEKRAYSRSAKARGIEYPPIKSPIDGTVHKVDNVSRFAREHNLDTGSLNKVLNKKAKSTKGWVLA